MRKYFITERDCNLYIAIINVVVVPVCFILPQILHVPITLHARSYSTPVATAALSWWRDFYMSMTREVDWPTANT